MRIYPAVHYTMGGLWVDYNLMTTIPGLYAIGEANFSDHGANRLGASSLMQCLADGYFILPVTIGDYLSRFPAQDVAAVDERFKQVEREVHDRVQRLLSVQGSRSTGSFHRELGEIMLRDCGISRSAGSLRDGLERIPKLRDEFWREVRVLGTDQSLNQSLEHAGRVADFLEFGELMCRDALERDESCGCHFREEHQTEDNEARRDDERFCNVAVWEYSPAGPILNVEPLVFTALPLAQRNYKT
jgi:succinate dehydrogenase / fumarate reductase flavoprotein subunit